MLLEIYTYILLCTCIFLIGIRKMMLVGSGMKEEEMIAGNTIGENAMRMNWAMIIALWVYCWFRKNDSLLLLIPVLVVFTNCIFVILSWIRMGIMGNASLKASMSEDAYRHLLKRTGRRKKRKHR